MPPFRTRSNQSGAAGPVSASDHLNVEYQGNGFSLNLSDAWHDQTVHLLVGPERDGLQHSISISTDADVDAASVEEYVDQQIASTRQQLEGCELVSQGPFTLADERSAYHAIFRHEGAASSRLLQVYVLTEQTAFLVSASFTEKTFTALRPKVERLIRSFTLTSGG